MRNTVTFYFGAGSRYSYLASTQLPRLGEETGTQFIWRAVYSPELISRAGSDPFDVVNRRGQYLPDYRDKDARRWAALYAVPYSEPDWKVVNWKRLALACVAAQRRGVAETYANHLLRLCFTPDESPPISDDDLANLARSIGLVGHDFIADLASKETECLHQQNIEAALEDGAFGVPTFITDTGELFFGQDRLPLLRHHLVERAERPLSGRIGQM